MYRDKVIARLYEAFEPERDDASANSMSAYMRGKFPYLGIRGPRRAELQRVALHGLARPTHDELAETALALWELPEREYQYAACDLVRRNRSVLTADFLMVARRLLETNSWWDTVDTLAANTVGGLVRRFSELGTEMDRWVREPNFWLARTAILHQLKWKTETNEKRLFDYCEVRASDSEFFIRKSIGWALREYSKTDSEAVRSFVTAHEKELSGLSKREALLWLNGGRSPKVSG
jgi:3-methyladenine DNA glycosylase AlkD